MQKGVLVLTTSAFVLACGAIAASAQQGPMTQQQPQILQQPDQERQLHKAPNFRAAALKIEIKTSLVGGTTETGVEEWA